MVLLVVLFYVFFFFKQKTAYEMRISDWSSDVCSSDLGLPASYRQGTHHLHLGGAPGRGAEPLRRGLNGVTTMAENLRRAAAERRSEERRVGKACVSTGRSRWSPYHYKQKQYNHKSNYLQLHSN